MMRVTSCLTLFELDFALAVAACTAQQLFFGQFALFDYAHD
jgi:hypothetical protein